MYVAVYRVSQKTGERSEKRVRTIEAESLDHAQEIFERDFRWKYPEFWGWEYEQDVMMNELVLV